MIEPHSPPSPGKPGTSAEEPDEEACVSIAHLLYAESRRGDGGTADWFHKAGLLLRDFARRSESLSRERQDELHRAMILAFRPWSNERPHLVPRTGTAHTTRDREPVDVAIVNILPDELSATLAVFGIEPVLKRGQPFYTTRVPCQSRPDRDLSVVITAAPRANQVHVGRPVVALLDRYCPGAAYLLGIAGGRQGRAAPGDVVIARRVFYYESGRATTTGIAPRPEIAEPDDEYGSGLYSYNPGETDFHRSVRSFIAGIPRDRRPTGLTDEFRPAVHGGPVVIASGELVLRDGRILPEMADRHDERIRAVDQEAYAFAQAVHGIPWAVFRGISDVADAHQDDRWKYVAAGFAALSLRDFLQTGFVPADVPEF